MKESSTDGQTVEKRAEKSVVKKAVKLGNAMDLPKVV